MLLNWFPFVLPSPLPGLLSLFLLVLFASLSSLSGPRLSQPVICSSVLWFCVALAGLSSWP